MHNQRTIHPVILCGGSGTRLWPLSRKSLPKQFAKLIGDNSLFQDSVSRLSGTEYAPPLIVTGDEFRFIVTEQLAAIEQDATGILIEPDGRNTAPAVLAAALWLQKTTPDALMLVAPSDHLIPDAQAFRQAIDAAAPSAVDGMLVTFGITPTRPETGFGYLELAIGTTTNVSEIQTLARFVEKPDALRAADMLASGKYLWNAGIFLFSVETILAAFREHAPQLLEKVTAAVSLASADLGFVRLDAVSWEQVDNISIDYAIMEKASHLAVMPFAAGWSDLGDWKSVWQESCPDANGNVCSAQATAIDCSGSLLRSGEGGPELVGIGLEDMIAVAMPDAVLIAPKSASQRVGEAVAALRIRGAKQADTSHQVQRPWGWFESISMGDRFQVKRICVKPGASLSLQSHAHRAEHWIVVAGTAQVTIGDRVQLVAENESVYVPLGEVHRLANPGDCPVEIIEVQTGHYLGEDDIVRYADIYARA